MNIEQPVQPVIDRNQMIKSHLYMVNFIVDRMVTQVPSYLTRDDMISAGMMGLINAADRFRPEEGVLFKTFAEKRVRGAILDEARKMDWASRPLREKHTRLTRTIAKLGHKYGRDPNEHEIAEELELSIEDYRDMLSQVGFLGCVSLHEEISPESGSTMLDLLPDENGPNPLTVLESDDQTHRVAALLEQLTDREKQVVALYYYEELSQKEIAEVMGVTEGRVSQLHSQALLKLKVKIGQE